MQTNHVYPGLELFSNGKSRGGTRPPTGPQSQPCTGRQHTPRGWWRFNGIMLSAIFLNKVLRFRPTHREGWGELVWGVSGGRGSLEYLDSERWRTAELHQPWRVDLDHEPPQAPTTSLEHVEDRSELSLSQNLSRMELHRWLARRKMTNNGEKLKYVTMSYKTWAITYHNDAKSPSLAL
jgi:hypothetical protein